MHKALISVGGALGALLLSPVVWAKVQGESGVSMPRDVSLHGHRIDFLINSVSIPIAGLFGIMVIWMGIAMVKHREGKHRAEYDHGTSARSAKQAIIISAVIFFGVDGWLFVKSMQDLDEAFWLFPETAESVRVEVSAQQWAWNFRYAGLDGKFNTRDDIVTLNDLRVPTGAPVLVKLTAKDVIHSFYLPNLRVKTDAIPGNTTRTWFQATETGEFDIACAQHCGTHHFKMRGKITILSPEDYATWLKEQGEIAVRAHDPDDPEAMWGWDWQDS